MMRAILGGLLLAAIACWSTPAPGDDFAVTGDLRGNIPAGRYAPGDHTHPRPDLSSIEAELDALRSRVEALEGRLEALEGGTVEPEPAPEDAIELPGRIEAAAYTAFHDLTPEDKGGANPRGDAVDIKNVAGEGLIVGWWMVGERLDYVVDIAEAGTYTLRFRTANGTGTTGAFRLSLDGAPLVDIPVAPTGSWATLTTVEAEVDLPAGVHDLRVEMTELYGDFAWIEVTEAGTPAPAPEPDPEPQPTPDEDVDVGIWGSDGERIARWADLLGKKPDYFSGKIHMEHGGLNQNTPVYDFIRNIKAAHPTSRVALIFDLYPNSHGGETKPEITNVAAGVYDAGLRALAQRLVDAGCTPDWPCVLRLWHEFNLGGRLWHEHPDWHEAWRRVHTLITGVAGAAVEFQYNVNGGSNWADALVDGYPGDEFVERVAMSCYPRGGSIEHARQKCLDRLDVVSAFAAEHGKIFDWPEWGLWAEGAACGNQGFGDTPEIVRESLDAFARAPNGGYVLYFDRHECADIRQFPQSQEAFREFFAR